MQAFWEVENPNPNNYLNRMSESDFIFLVNQPKSISGPRQILGIL